MVPNALASWIDVRRARRSARAARWELAASQAARAANAHPYGWPRALAILDRAEKARRWNEASTLLRSLPSEVVGDQADVALRLSYHDEQRSYPLDRGPIAPSSDVRRIAFFNDTDGRPNIGCRLTSVGLKDAFEASFPGCSVRSRPLDFASLGKRGEGLPEEQRIAVAYGKGALAEIEKADLVVVQPEGSLGAGVSVDALRNLFSPIREAARLGKRAVVLNGTIPDFRDERRAVVDELLRVAHAKAGRDARTAANYDIDFLADAALLREPQSREGERGGLLITTGARNSQERDDRIFSQALALSETHGLRPIVLTRNSARGDGFRARVKRAGGVFAETASLPEAERLISGCSLHVGGRYHMALFAYLCGTPTLLYEVETGKNAWLTEMMPTIHAVDYDREISALADKVLLRPTERYDGQSELMAKYASFLHAAIG